MHLPLYRRPTDRPSTFASTAVAATRRVTPLALSVSAVLLAAPLLADDTVPVTLAFAGEFGGQPFDCATRFEGIGAGGASVAVADYRLYVSRVRLLDASGGETPLVLDDDGRWQSDGVALVDFEDGTGHCTNGTAPTNDSVTGRAPAGDYTGVAFDIGVPFESNHGDPTLAASPLNLTGMFWNWRGGYRFVRVDLASVENGAEHDVESAVSSGDGAGHGGMASADAEGKRAATGDGSMQHDAARGDTMKHDGAMAHGGAMKDDAAMPGDDTTAQAAASGHERPAHGSGHGGGHGGGWALHVGSTGCSAPTPTTAPDSCAAPNRIEVVLDDFDADVDTLIVDPAPVLAGVDVSSNTPDTAPGCMSSPDDPECDPVLDALGLGEGDATQTLVRTR